MCGNKFNWNQPDVLRQFYERRESSRVITDEYGAADERVSIFRVLREKKNKLNYSSLSI